MKFSEMVYERPDLEMLKVQLTQLIDNFRAADSYESAREVFLEK